MSQLRIQMDNAMLVRGMAERTRETYLAAVARLARHYHRPPDQLSPTQVQAYVAHMLREEHLAWSTCNIAVQAFRFLYHTTTPGGRPWSSTSTCTASCRAARSHRTGCSGSPPSRGSSSPCAR